MDRIGPISPKDPNTPEAAELQLPPTIDRTEMLEPPQTPIGHATIDVEQQAKRLIRDLVAAKATLVFTAKSTIVTYFPPKMSMGGGMGMGTTAQSLMTTIGSLLLGINLPVALFETYTLAKDWQTLSATDRLTRGAKVSAHYLLSGAGMGVLIAKIPELAALLKPGGAMLSMKVALILGPIGMGILSILSLKMSGESAVEAVKLDKRRNAAKELFNHPEVNDFQKTLLGREGGRFENSRNFAIADSVRYLFIGVGVGIGALVMAGLIGGALATPFGWVAVALVAGGLVVGVAVYAYRRYRAEEQERIDSEGLVNLLKEQRDVKDFLREQLDKLSKLSPNHQLFIDPKTYADELLNSAIWPKNRTIQELLDASKSKEP